jgi:hypothetical protein
VSKSDLRIDWATHAAAKYACENWHYSGCIPKSKLVKIGAWECGRFIGVVIFGLGANMNIGKPYGLQLTECCELVRVALAKHSCHVTRIVALAIKFLKKTNTHLRLIVSFADPVANHHGGIYQGGNWLYSGKCACSREVLFNGKWTKRIDKTRGHTGPTRKVPGKHRYLMPLDDEMRKQIESLRKPYPKRVRSVDGDTPAIHAGEGGSTPTRTL